MDIEICTEKTKLKMIGQGLLKIQLYIICITKIPQNGTYIKLAMSDFNS